MDCVKENTRRGKDMSVVKSEQAWNDLNEVVTVLQSIPTQTFQSCEPSFLISL